MATHQVQPTTYHRTMGSHAPILRIAPGDSVITSTVDAFGRDAQNQEVTPGGNPQTGPFYIEGAEPGDTLVVHLDRIVPNREIGYTRAALATNVVDPDYVPRLPERVLAEWSVDVAAGVARLNKPSTRLGAFQVPLAPMLGCFGVAPADGQAISTATSAEHGGNMDYRGFTSGVTVYFPVLVPGALFHLGDGHAAQGDGEIVGTGIEISLDVQFTIDLRKGQAIGWPRADDGEYILTAGNARPLDQALQHATTEMMRWLETEWGLDAVEASILLGQHVRYEVGNVFDPAYTMICKVPKQVLVALSAD
jgi:amidase